MNFFFFHFVNLSKTLYRLKKRLRDKARNRFWGTKVNHEWNEVLKENCKEKTSLSIVRFDKLTNSPIKICRVDKMVDFWQCNNLPGQLNFDEFLGQISHFANLSICQFVVLTVLNSVKFFKEFWKNLVK